MSSGSYDIPVFSDICNYLVDDKVLVEDYFIINGIIEKPKDYQGLVIKNIREEKGKLVIETSIVDLIIDHNMEFLVNKEGFRSKLKIIYDKEKKAYIVAVEPLKPIDGEKLVELIKKKCLGE